MNNIEPDTNLKDLKSLSRESIGKVAFYKCNHSLDDLLRESFPTGCTLRQAIGWAETLSDETIEECEAIG